MSWARRELEQTQLGDKRRERRLVKIVEDLAGSPESSVPLASRDRAALQGMYDFWSNRRVKAADILSGHLWNTVNPVTVATRGEQCYRSRTPRS